MIFLIAGISAVGAIEFDLGKLGSEWVKEESREPRIAPDGSIIQTVYQRSAPLSGVYRIIKPVPDGKYLLAFQEHAKQLRELAQDFKVAASKKPKDVVFRKVGDDYLMTLVKPIEPDRRQILFTAYRKEGVEQLIVDVPRENQSEGYELAKKISGLSDLERIKSIDPELIVVNHQAVSGARAEAYEQTKSYMDVVMTAFGVILGGVLIAIFFKRKESSSETAPSSYFSVDQLKDKGPEVPSSDSSDSD